jgi:hypothetical protein
MMRDRVRKGMRARDLDGRTLGRVTRLHRDAFEIEGGFPVLFRKEFVASYDEVREVQDGVVIVARSENALLDLAAGKIPPTWHPGDAVLARRR